MRARHIPPLRPIRACHDQVRRVLFSDDGGALLSGAEESLKVWGWEPVRCFEQLDVRWSRLTDMCIGPGQQLLGGSVRDSMVSVWSVDMKAMKPFDSMLPEVPPPQAQAIARASVSSASPTRCRAATVDGALPVSAVFTQRPAPGACAANNGVGTTPPSVGRMNAAVVASPSLGAVNVDDSPEDDDAAAKCARLQIAQCRAQLAARRVSQGKESGGGASGCADASSEMSSTPGLSQERARPAVQRSARPTETSVAASRHVSVGTSMSGTLMRGEAAADTVPAPFVSVADGETAGRRSEARTAPVATGAAHAVRTSATPIRSEEQVVAYLVGQSPRQGACLAERLGALRVLLDLWQAGDVKKMLQHLNRLDDPSVAVDVVKAGVLKGGRLDLECALVLLPTLDTLLGSTFDDHALAAIEAVSQLVLIFGQLIRNTRAVAHDMLGVDLSAEARQQRCQACYEQFTSMLPRLRQLALGSGKLKRASGELLEVLVSEIGLTG